MKLFLATCLVWIGGFLAGYAVSEATAALVNGTAADDFLVGTSGKDTMYGKGGKDELHAKGGDDFLDGGGGGDLLEGEAGNDYMVGRKGPDVLYAAGGTSGVDYVSCGGGEDWAYVGPLDSVTSSCEHVQVL